MKGQFFIISTVIIIAALIIITQYFYDYSKTDLTEISDLQELYYIQDVKDSLTRTVELTDCAYMDSELEYTEDFLKDKLLERGIILTITHDSTVCPTIDFDFTVESAGYRSETSFSV